jgi:hypothetical protein
LKLQGKHSKIQRLDAILKEKISTLNQIRPMNPLVEDVEQLQVREKALLFHGIGVSHNPACAIISFLSILP